MAKPGPWENRWQILRDLGKGGQGTTHVVRRMAPTCEEAVLKVLKNTSSEQARRRMRQETVNLDIVANAGGKVPRVLDGNTDEYQDVRVPLYFVMEYVRGGTLTEYIESHGPMTVDKALALVVDVCSTVDCGHKEGVQHRDLKPQNIVLRNDVVDDAVVVDFGLSFNHKAPEDITKVDERFRNAFLSLPEANLIADDRRDPRSDLTIVCGLLYYCLTGHIPEMLRDSQNRAPHRRERGSLREFVQGDRRMPHLEAVLDRGFGNDITQRFQTCSELLNRLQGILDSGQNPPVEDPVLFAARASEMYLQRDRKAQLAAFAVRARALLKSLSDYFSGLQNKLGQFLIAPQPFSQVPVPLPSGIENVVDGPTFSINPAHHNQLRMVAYKVGAHGYEAILFKLHLARFHDQDAEITPLGSWVEVLPYSALENPDPAPAIEDLKAWIIRAIQELLDASSVESPSA